VRLAEALPLGEDERRSNDSDFPGPGAPNSAPASKSQRTQGLDVTRLSPPIAAGEVFLLDIPFYRTRHAACNSVADTHIEVTNTLQFHSKAIVRVSTQA
jgi:hypothetical protein